MDIRLRMLILAASAELAAAEKDKAKAPMIGELSPKHPALSLDEDTLLEEVANLPRLKERMRAILLGKSSFDYVWLDQPAVQRLVSKLGDSGLLL